MKLRKNRPSFVAYKGPSMLNGDPVVAIVSQHKKSQNPKTGNMSQLWIIRSDISPAKAIETGKDDAICGNCALRKVLCYVIPRAPQSVWWAFKRGRYSETDTTQAHRNIRLGAYGDPAALPETAVKKLVDNAVAIGKRWTGYTHQWNRKGCEWLKLYVMASCDTVAQRNAAKAKGWRTFRTKKPWEPVLPGEIYCPAPKVSCDQCGLCCGTSRKAKDVVIDLHGVKSKKFTKR